MNPNEFIELCESGTAAQVREALKAGVDVNARDDDGETALMNAVWNAPEVVDALLDAGADANLRDRSGWRPLDHARRREELKGTDALARLERATRTEFIDVCRSGTAQQVREALRAGANVNARTEDGTTILMAATSGNTPEIVALLLQAGALVPERVDVNAKDEEGETALMMAARAGELETLRLLLQAGADVNARSGDGMTALIRAATKDEPDGVELIRALIEAGADVNAQDDYGMTALIDASEANGEEAVRLLLDAGANVNARNKEGMTALHWTLAPENIRALLQAGADVNARREDGRTALMQSLLTPEGIDLLLDAGADATARDNEGKGALDYLRENKYLKGTEALRRLEAASRRGITNTTEKEERA